LVFKRQQETLGGAEVGTVTLTIDTDGSGKEGDASDGSEDPFFETVASGSIRASP